jgi:hypothetical protein
MKRMMLRRNNTTLMSTMKIKVTLDLPLTKTMLLVV